MFFKELIEKFGNPKYIGIFLLAKHFLLVIAILLLIPILSVLFDSGSFRPYQATMNFYRVKTNDEINKYFIYFLFCHLFFAIYVSGKFLSKPILSNQPYLFIYGFFAVFGVWLYCVFAYLFIGGLPKYGYGQLSLLIALLTCIIHSLFAGFFIQLAVKKYRAFRQEKKQE